MAAMPDLERIRRMRERGGPARFGGALALEDEEKERQTRRKHWEHVARMIREACMYVVWMPGQSRQRA